LQHQRYERVVWDLPLTIRRRCKTGDRITLAPPVGVVDGLPLDPFTAIWDIVPRPAGGWLTASTAQTGQPAKARDWRMSACHFSTGAAHRRSRGERFDAQ
jgi:hypothetical protein